MAANVRKNEFVVQRSKVDLLTAHNGKKLQRVNSLFSVDIFITSSGDKSGEWVTVKGLPEDCEKATEYIKSLCNPDHELLIKYPPKMHSELIGPGGAAHRELESSSGAVVMFESGEARLLGSQMAVLLASSQIEDAIKRFQDADDMALAKAAAASFDIDAELHTALRRSESDVPPEDYESQPDHIKRAILDELIDLRLSNELDDDGETECPLEPASSSSSDVTPASGSSARSLWDIDHFQMTMEKQRNASVLEVQCKPGTLAETTDLSRDGASTGAGKKKRKRKSKKQEETARGDPLPTGPGALESGSSRPPTSTENGITSLACNFNLHSTQSPDTATTPAFTISSGMSSQGFASSGSVSAPTSVSSIRPVQVESAVRPLAPHFSASTNTGGLRLSHPVATGMSQPRPMTVSNLSCNSQVQPAPLSSHTISSIPSTVAPLATTSAQLLKPDELTSGLGTPPSLANGHQPVTSNMHGKHLISQTVSQYPKPLDTWPGQTGLGDVNPAQQWGSTPAQQGKHDQRHGLYNHSPAQGARPFTYADSAASQLHPRPGSHHSSLRPGPPVSTHPRPAFSECPHHAPLPRVQPIAGRPGSLRPIVIDGSNVAMHHGNGRVFSCKGIRIAIEWFLQRGHEVTALVPNHRQGPSAPGNPVRDQHILQLLKDRGQLVFTPSRKIGNRRVVCYDDRFIVRVATANGGIIVSNDHYRDLQQENVQWKAVIEQRLLQYAFVGDLFIPADDPLGRMGPPLDEFLRWGR